MSKKWEREADPGKFGLTKAMVEEERRKERLKAAHDAYAGGWNLSWTLALAVTALGGYIGWECGKGLGAIGGICIGQLVGVFVALQHRRARGESLKPRPDYLRFKDADFQYYFIQTDEPYRKEEAYWL